MYRSYTVYYHVFLCIINNATLQESTNSEMLKFPNKKQPLCNMHRNMTSTKINTIIKIFDDYNGDCNKYIELCRIWFLVSKSRSKLSYHFAGGDNTDGIDNQHITYLDSDNRIIRPTLYYATIMRNIYKNSCTHTLWGNPLMTTLLRASSHMSHELNFHTCAAILYSSIKGSCNIHTPPFNSNFNNYYRCAVWAG